MTPTTAPAPAVATQTPASARKCVCGRLIVPGRFLPFAHLTNPGRDHHYVRPATRSGAPDLAGAQEPRVAETSRRTGSPVRFLPPRPDAG